MLHLIKNVYHLHDIQQRLLPPTRQGEVAPVSNVIAHLYVHPHPHAPLPTKVTDGYIPSDADN